MNKKSKQNKRKENEKDIKNNKYLINRLYMTKIERMKSVSDNTHK